MYLEMTYFSNVPEPEKPQPASAPKNKILSNFLDTHSLDLQRRPSKLSPADRLSRPRQTSASLAFGQTSLEPQPPGAYPHVSYSPPVQQQQLPDQGGWLPPSLAPSYGTSPQSRWDPLPLPSGPDNHESLLPSLLRPGGGKTPPSSSPVSVPQLISPQLYGQNRRPSASPSQSPYLGPQFGSSPPVSLNLNPYIGGNSPPGPAQSPNMILHHSLQSQTGPSAAVWRQDNPIFDTGAQGVGGFVFPIPVDDSQDPLGGFHPPPQPQIRYARPTHIRAGSDPLLLRYSTPLPLPPGAIHGTQPVAPTPTPEISPPTYPPILPSKENQFSPDPSRFEALRRAEEDAKRKHEQEIRDLELAMQLDRELNLS